jgi:hypothetical protein
MYPAGQPWRGLQVVGALAPAALLAVIWRRRARATRWRNALDAYAAREIVRAQLAGRPGRRMNPARTGAASASFKRVG